MAILIQSLSWTLIYSLGQGFVLYAALWLVLKLMPTTQANVKYHLSLSTLTILLVWFVGTWWQQYHAIALANEHAISTQGWSTITIQQLQASGIIDNNGWYHSLATTINVIFPWLSAFYFVGLALMLMRLSSGMLGLFALRTSGISQAGAALDELLASLKNRLQLEGGVRLLISAKAQVPMVIGFFKPIVLVPAAVMAQLSTEQLETIILHELAHIKRHDYLVNILQTVVETILFFNPFAWMISAVTRREREHCCDDLVLAHSPEPLYYATALAALANNPETVTTFTVAASGDSNHLFNRIKRIMEMKKNPFSYSRTAAAILIIAIITCSIAWLSPSFAGSKKDKHNDTAPSAATTAAKDALVTDKDIAPGTEKKETDAKQVKDKNADAKPGQPATIQKEAAKVDIGEEQTLVNRLMNDRLIDEIKGFTVEKRENTLFIDGKRQTDELAAKYLATLKKEIIRVRVFSFADRLRMHPENGLIKNLIPVSFQSGCVDYGNSGGKGKKDGC